MNVSNMSLEEKQRLAAELAPHILSEFRGTSEMIIPGSQKAVKVSIRLLDSGKISSHTHDELEAAEAALDSATTIAALKVAVKAVIKVFKMVIMGKQSVSDA